MTKKLDHFEKLIQDKLNAQEFEYSPESWDSLQNKLQPKKPFYLKPANIAITGIAAALVTTVILYTSDLSENDKTKSTQQPIGKNIETEANIKENNSTIDVKEISSVSDNKELQKEHIKAVDHFVSSDNLNKTVKENSQTNQSNSNTLDQSETNSLSNEVSDNLTETNESNVNNTVANLVKDTSNQVNNSTNTPEPIAAFYVNKTNGCINEPFTFNAIEQENMSYKWSFGDGTTSTERSPSHTYTKAGNYNIKLTVKSNNGLKADYSEDQIILIHPKSSTDFAYDIKNENGIPYTNFILDDQNSISSIKWDFGDSESSSEISPEHTYRKKGTYSVTLTVTNDFGCSSTMSKQVYIDVDYNLLAPASFTANNDNLNDNFIPAAIDLVAESFTMTIYSPTGKVLYETSNFNEPWDGTDHKTGLRCLSGNYIWVVKLIDKNGKPDTYNGSVLLLR